MTEEQSQYYPLVTVTQSMKGKNQPTSEINPKKSGFFTYFKTPSEMHFYKSPQLCPLCFPPTTSWIQFYMPLEICKYSYNVHIRI